MRSYSSTFTKVLAGIALISLASCVSGGANPPGADKPCTSDDGCPPTYQCLPSTHGGVGLFCCKDRSNCGPTGSSGTSTDGPGAGTDGAVIGAGPDGAGDSVGGSGGSATGGSPIAGAGGSSTGGSGGSAAGGSSTAGAGGSSTGGAVGTPDASVDAPITLLAQGKACAAGSDCASGNCVDGFCCDKAKAECTGCNACANAATGLDNGTCGAVSVGKDPHDTCADETATNQCGNDGTCDGKGACRKVGTSHTCTQGVCSADGKTFTAATTCDGKGACTTSTPQSCGAFQCSTTGCLITCSVQSDCAGDNYCNTSVTPSVCAAKKVNGSPATQAYECKSKVVADGVCCDKTCSGCSACTLAINKQTGAGATDGQCLPVVAGAAGHGTCTASPPCGLDGTCDGNGGCRYTAGGTTCAADSCTGSTLTTSVCVTASHTCVSTPNACPNSTSCAASGTSCGTKKVQGAACSSTADCATGTCVDNAAGTGKICCASACSGACQACAADGSACTTKNAGVADSGCGGSTTCHTGTCAAGGTCQLSPAGTNCGAGLYCTVAGQCSCQGGGSCQPTNPCKTGTISCATGSPVCTESGNQLSSVNCGSGPSCSSSTKYLQQKCDGNGSCAAQQSQACPTNQTCSGTDCACLSPNTTCSGACVNTQTSATNCGTCGRSCGTGGTCSDGKCQPIVLASNLPGYSFVFGVDASYVYYSQCTGYYDCTPKRIPISGGTPATLMDTVYVSGFGVMGNILFLFQNQVASFLCSIGSTCQATASTRMPDGMSAGFKSAPSYFPVNTWSNSSTEITTWYNTSNATFTAYGSPHYWTHNCDGGVNNFGVAGSYQYWACGNGSGSYTIWRTNGSIPSTAISQITGSFSFYPNLVDANSQSLIYYDSTPNNLYRVPIPGGLGTTGTPQLIVNGTGTKFVTEDSSGIYWIDSLANLNRCSASACSSTTTVLATGQTLGTAFKAGLGSALYLDSGYVYWINGSGQLLKLAK